MVDKQALQSNLLSTRPESDSVSDDQAGSGPSFGQENAPAGASVPGANGDAFPAQGAAGNSDSSVWQAWGQHRAT